jgi:Flp pilus assembly pilin Flp
MEFGYQIYLWAQVGQAVVVHQERAQTARVEVTVLMAAVAVVVVAHQEQLLALVVMEVQGLLLFLTGNIFSYINK